MTVTRREYEELRRELARVKQELAQRPLFGGGGAGAPNTIYTLQIIGGNTLDDAVTDGVKYVGTLTDVPSIYDPDVDTTFVDGIGRAALFIDGVLQSGNVLVLHDSSGGSIVDALFADDICLSSPATVSLPLSGDPTQSVTLYRVYTP
jgi:hypothetical protein